MNGREMYEAERGYGESLGFYDMPDWDQLTPARQAAWEDTAAEFVQKRLDDEAHNRMLDEGGPCGSSD
jgi:hypothetical protein